MRHEEHNIQVAAVRWFWMQWPKFRGLLFAIPNDGARNKAVAGKLRAEGVTAGVADMCLAVRTAQYGALYVEFKTARGTQSPAQKEWQKQAEMGGNLYVVCRSIEEFQKVINEYLEGV